jgi:hypothetical protein
VVLVDLVIITMHKTTRNRKRAVYFDILILELLVRLVGKPVVELD